MNARFVGICVLLWFGNGFAEMWPLWRSVEERINAVENGVEVSSSVRKDSSMGIILEDSTIAVIVVARGGCYTRGEAVIDSVVDDTLYGPELTTQVYGSATLTKRNTVYISEDTLSWVVIETIDEPDFKSWGMLEVDFVPASTPMPPPRWGPDCESSATASNLIYRGRLLRRRRADVDVRMYDLLGRRHATWRGSQAVGIRVKALRSASGVNVNLILPVVSSAAAEK